jgi:hypothetical protein
MVGIGKTALAKSVYESQELSCMFEQGAWVSVMRPFNLEDVLISLARQLKIVHLSVLAQENQQALVSRSLKSEDSVKPLNGIGNIIVLDGVLSTEEWKLIKSYLPATNAKRIIVTTTEASVAEHCSTEYTNIYKLQALDDVAALELFKSKVPPDRCRTFYVSYEFGSEREREIGEGERDGYLLFESGNSNQ